MQLVGEGEDSTRVEYSPSTRVVAHNALFNYRNDEMKLSLMLEIYIVMCEMLTSRLLWPVLALMSGIQSL